jgi:hypothetical protein
MDDRVIVTRPNDGYALAFQQLAAAVRVRAAAQAEYRPHRRTATEPAYR